VEQVACKVNERTVKGDLIAGVNPEYPFIFLIVMRIQGEAKG
jgi:hypothetical protein